MLGVTTFVPLLLNRKHFYSQWDSLSCFSLFRSSLLNRILITDICRKMRAFYEWALGSELKKRVLGLPYSIWNGDWSQHSVSSRLFLIDYSAFTNWINTHDSGRNLMANSFRSKSYFFFAAHHFGIRWQLRRRKDRWRGPLLSIFGQFRSKQRQPIEANIGFQVEFWVKRWYCKMRTIPPG